MDQRDDVGEELWKIKSGNVGTLVTIDEIEDEAGHGQLRGPLSDGRIPITWRVHRLATLAVQDLPSEVRALAGLERPLTDCDGWRRKAYELIRSQAKYIGGYYS